MVRFYLEGEKLLETDPNKLFAIVLSNIKDIKWWSTESIIEFIDGTHCELIKFARARKEELQKEKFAKRSEKTKLTKFINRGIKIPSDREKLMQFYYKLILSNEKKGLLPGFGMSGTMINPEYRTIKELPNDRLE